MILLEECYIHIFHIPVANNISAPTKKTKYTSGAKSIRACREIPSNDDIFINVRLEITS